MWGSGWRMAVAPTEHSAVGGAVAPSSLPLPVSSAQPPREYPLRVVGAAADSTMPISRMADGNEMDILITAEALTGVELLPAPAQVKRVAVPPAMPPAKLPPQPLEDPSGLPSRRRRRKWRFGDGVRDGESAGPPVPRTKSIKRRVKRRRPPDHPPLHDASEGGVLPRQDGAWIVVRVLSMRGLTLCRVYRGGCRCRGSGRSRSRWSAAQCCH
jgi:hypothetical protein